MVTIQNLSVIHTETKSEILHNISIQFEAGKTYLLQGPNGSGKSTLANTLLGHPDYTILNGRIDFIKSKKESSEIIDITNVTATERSLLGMFLVNQHPIEIPGVSLLNYLRILYRIHHPEDKMPVFAFKKYVSEKSAEINYPSKLLDRYLNDGLSGGEKKKTEILQMMMIEPRFIILDELDSGLDKQSVHEVFTYLQKYKKLNPGCTIVIISHYDKVTEYLNPDKIVTFSHGTIIQ